MVQSESFIVQEQDASQCEDDLALLIALGSGVLLGLEVVCLGGVKLDAGLECPVNDEVYEEGVGDEIFVVDSQSSDVATKLST